MPITDPLILPPDVLLVPVDGGLTLGTFDIVELAESGVNASSLFQNLFG